MARPVAVVTGGARGIGLESARRLARTHRVALLDLDGDGARDAAEGIGGDALWDACDITDGASVAAAVAGVVERAGGIDVAISNAGIATSGTLRHLHPDVLAAQLEVNLTGNWRFIHACLPHVVDRRGYVLGVASLAAIAGAPGLGMYAASKAGLERLLDVLRYEVAPLGVDVGVAYFSFIDTEMVRGAQRLDPSFDRMLDDMRGPLSRITPVEAVGRAIERAVRRRARRVYVPRWVGAVQALRGVADRVSQRDMVRAAPEIDAVTAEVVAQRGAFGAGLRPDDRGAEAAARAVERSRV